MPADARDLDSPPPHRFGEPRRVALESRDEARGERDGERGVARERGAGDEAVVVEEERVGGEREPDRREAKRGDGRERDLFPRHVQLAEHRDDRPLPDHVDPGRLEERPDQEDPEGRSPGAEEVGPQPASAPAGREGAAPPSEARAAARGP